MPGDEATSYLVRHAKAGSRERWTAPDRDRPLTAPGKVQAEALAKLLAPMTVRVLSSPYLRCVQTVAPLAEAVGVRVEEEDRLAEGADPAWAMTALASAPGSVLCTHGDVMASIVMTLAGDKVPMDGGSVWAKAGTWAFEIKVGRIVAGRYLPPPV
jgi:8-oxo-dGTP diphosphatase